MSNSSEPVMLPSPSSADGHPRRLGVEIEFGGLSEARSAEITAQLAGGRIDEIDHGDFQVKDTAFGDCRIYLDTAFRKEAGESELGRRALELARVVVPVELVTAPFDPVLLPALDDLTVKLREAGAYGTRRGILLGYGVHLNIEIRDESAAHLWSVLTAFALCEAQLRRAFPIDLSRRALPFVDPYPKALLDALSRGPAKDTATLERIYLERVSSRNHALDMLPIFAHLNPSLAGQSFGSRKGVSARPAFHYRMPDCRIDEPDWSISGEWALWVAIERLAEDDTTLKRLCAAWRDHRLYAERTAFDWAKRTEMILRQAGHNDLAPAGLTEERGWSWT